MAAGPVANGLGVVHRLQHQLGGQFAPPPLENRAHIQSPHPADAQAIDFILAQRVKPIPQAYFDISPSQGVLQFGQRPGIFLHRDDPRQTLAQKARQVPVVAADIGVTRSLDAMGDGLQARTQHASGCSALTGC